MKKHFVFSVEVQAPTIANSASQAHAWKAILVFVMMGSMMAMENVHLVMMLVLFVQGVIDGIVRSARHPTSFNLMILIHV